MAGVREQRAIRWGEARRGQTMVGPLFCQEV